MTSDKIYVNWKEPNQFRRSLREQGLRFQPGHRETWNFDSSEPYLLYSTGSGTSSLSFVCRQSASLGRPSPCHLDNFYCNTENRSSRCIRDNCGHGQAKDIFFVNSQFDDDIALEEKRKRRSSLLNLTSDGTQCKQLDDMYARSSCGFCAVHGVFQPTFQSCPPPCTSREDPENYYEVAECPRPPKPRRTVHSQYISLERALSMEGKPQIPPRNKLSPENRDSIRLNMSGNEPEGEAKGYDLKVCLPHHFNEDVHYSKAPQCTSLQENIIRKHSSARPHLLPVRVNSCCGNCREPQHKQQTLQHGHPTSCVHLDGYSECPKAKMYTTNCDTCEMRPACNRRRREHQRSSHGGFRSYLDDCDRESILTSFSSTEALASVGTPTWFDELITTTFPTREESGLRRRSFSLSSLPSTTQPARQSPDAESLVLENNIQRDCKVFLKIRSYSKIKSQLRRDGHIIITGYPGAGKTALAYQILRDFAADGASPIVIDAPGAFPQRIPSGKAILLIDDMFGSICFEENNIDLWKKVLKKMDDVWDDRFREKGPNGRLSFFCIGTTRSYVLKEALPFLGKYNGTIFNTQHIIDLSDQVLNSIEKMNIIDNHAKVRGNGLDFETREKIIHCSTYAFPQLCQLYFAGLQNAETALLFFKQPMKFLVLALESLFLRDKIKFASLLLVALTAGNINTAQLENNKNVEDDLKVKVQLALKYGEVKEPLPSLTEMGQNLKLMKGSFINMDGDWASFMHPTISDAVIFIAGERNIQFLLKYASMKFIYDRVRINPQLPCGTLTRPSEGDRTQFLLFLSPAHYRGLAKRFSKEVTTGHFSLVCAHDACSLYEFVEVLFAYMNEKGLVSSSASNLSARLHRKSGIHSSEKDHGGKFLYWTVWNKNQELCKHMLHKCFFTKKEKSQAIIGCSLSGNVKAMALLLEDLQADSVTYQPGSTMPSIEVRFSYGIESSIQHILVLGSTPLHIGAERGQLGIVKLLLSKGANVNKKGPRVAATPLHYACQGGHTDVAATLLQSGADVNSLDWVSRTPLHWAASKGHSDTVKFLTFNRSFLDAPDAEGLTPLHCSAWGGHLEACVTLLNAGASPKARTHYNKTPLDISIDESFKKKFHDTIVFDFDVYVDDTGLASWLVGLRGPLILSVSATSIMVKRPRNREILFEWSLRTLRRFGHSYTSFKFEAGRNCETGEGVYNFLSADAQDLMECVKMRLACLEDNNKMLFHRRAPPLH